jgi:regulator of sigma E protease
MDTIIAILTKLRDYSLTAFFFLLVITIIATIHEYGHYIICKILGVRVDEFSIGFGKLLLSKRWGETEYNLRAIPIAAYVRPAGMDPAEEEMEGYVDPGERSFNKKNSVVKYAILFGGSVFNIISTVLFLTLLFMKTGSGDSTVLVKGVSKNSPAHQAGIQEGDRFVKIDGEPILDADKAIRRIKDRPCQWIQLIVKRGDQELTLKLRPENDDGQGRIGISYGPDYDKATLKPMEFWPAMSKAREKTWEYVMISYSAALKMFTRSFSKKEIPKDVGGPVSIVGAVGSRVQGGMMSIPDLLEILAMLSLAIGVFNLLPIPALDGGRILILFLRDMADLAYTLVTWRQPKESLLSHRMEEVVHLLGIFSLLLLLLVVTYKDIRELVVKTETKLPVYSTPSSNCPD